MTSVHTQQLTLSSLADLSRFADVLSAWLQPGDVVTLDGPLGAGKTTLTQALARHLDILEPVTSPTYGLMSRYDRGRFPFLHCDLYRLGPQGADSLFYELDEILEARSGILLVEWATYAPWLAEEATLALTLAYHPTQPEARIITWKAKRPLSLNADQWPDPPA